MSGLGFEGATQNRVLRLFQETLGYRDLGDWHNPEANDFAIAEDVTLKGTQKRRPDLVLDLSGIAIGVIELKRSRVSIGDDIRQNLSNQQPEFNAWFLPLSGP